MLLVEFMQFTKILTDDLLVWLVVDLLLVWRESDGYQPGVVQTYISPSH